MRVRMAAWLLATALTVWPMMALAQGGPPGAGTPGPTPGGPREARNCSIPFSEKRKPSFDPNGKLVVRLDEAARVFRFEVQGLPAGATCFVIGQPGAGTWPNIFVWDPAGVSGGVVAETVRPGSAGRYCFSLLFGDAEGHSGMSDEVCVDVPASVAPTPTVTPTLQVFPTPRPPTVGDSRPADPGPPVVSIAVAVLITACGVGASRAG
jgi:hypothetical protein